jgi:transposase
MTRTPAQTRELKAAAWEFVAEGRSVRYIARELGVPLGTIQRWCHGLERPEPIRLKSPENRAMNRKMWEAGLSLETRREYFAKQKKDMGGHEHGTGSQ